jgi:hypothetical protein
VTEHFHRDGLRKTAYRLQNNARKPRRSRLGAGKTHLFTY